MLNKVQLIGHLGADPDVRKTQDGRPIANMRIATSERWKDKTTGERKERTHWHTVVIFNEGLAKVAEAYLKKGSKVYLEGQLQTRKWQDKEGNDRYSTEVVMPAYGGALVMLDTREGAGGPERSEGDYGEARSKSPPAGNSAPANDYAFAGEEIPF